MGRTSRVAFLAFLMLALLPGAASGRGTPLEEAQKDPFWLGPSFEGLAFDQEGFARGGSIAYGECELPEGEGGCLPPAEVQTQTSCGRNPIAIDSLPERVWLVRGGGLAVAYEPGAVDVGTGNRTVTLFTEPKLMSSALREVRLRSQPTPLPMAPPVYPKAVLGELKRVTAAADRLHGIKAVAKAIEVRPAEVRVRLRIAELLGPKALAGVSVPRTSTKEIERLRQLAFSVHEFGLAATARDNGITVAKLKAEISRVRGLAIDC